MIVELNKYQNYYDFKDGQNLKNNKQSNKLLINSLPINPNDISQLF